MSKETYVIVGFGWVGQANAIAMKLMGFDVAYYDIAETHGHYAGTYASVYAQIPRISVLGELDSSSTWYFVCVGDRVSESGEQDISHIRGVLDSLAPLEGKVVLRSTVLPDLLENLSFHCYVPEFLHEQKAVEECVDPYLFVVGSVRKGEAEPKIFAEWRRRARRVFKGSPREAAFVKYLSNIWNAVRIALVNELGDTIGCPQDKEQLQTIERVVNFVLGNKAYLRYGKSFGGHCLPKDTRAFRAWYKKKGGNVSLIAGAYTSNEAHRALESTYPMLPEWFSEWPGVHISGKQALSELWYAIMKYVRRPKLLILRFLKKQAV
jgi:UDP-glucose 6-dehydrogenase